MNSASNSFPSLEQQAPTMVSQIHGSLQITRLFAH
jgi:hypothetical protein